MLQLITRIPIFVWPLFFILLLGGLRARKANAMPLSTLLLLPCVFFVWSIFSFFGKYEIKPFLILSWTLSLSLGICCGYLYTQKLALQFDKQSKKVELPGSWVPLILSMSIFSSKFIVGMLSAMEPRLNGSFLLLGIELFATAIFGVFAGRGINCFVRYRAVDL